MVLVNDDLVLLGSCNTFAKSILQDSEDLVVPLIELQPDDWAEPFEMRG